MTEPSQPQLYVLHADMAGVWPLASSRLPFALNLSCHLACMVSCVFRLAQAWEACINRELSCPDFAHCSRELLMPKSVHVSKRVVLIKVDLCLQTGRCSMQMYHERMNAEQHPLC